MTAPLPSHLPSPRPRTIALAALSFTFLALGAAPRPRDATAFLSSSGVAPAEPRGQAPIVLLSTERIDVGDHATVVHEFTWPGGEHVTVARAKSGDAAALAGEPGVFAVLEDRNTSASAAEESGWPTYGAALRARLAEAPDRRT